MTTLISTQYITLRGRNFAQFEVFELSEEERFDQEIDTLQSYLNRGFVQQTPPQSDPKFWKVENGQVATMDEQEQADLLEAEADEQVQAQISNERMALDRDIAFGQNLFKEYILDNRKIQGLTVEQVMAQGQYGVSLKLMLDSGSLTTAKAFISQIPDELFLSGSKTLYINKIDEYLNQ